MLWWLVFLIAIALCCSFLAPASGLHKSALQAFDSSVGVLSRVRALNRKTRLASLGAPRARLEGAVLRPRSFAASGRRRDPRFP